MRPHCNECYLSGQEGSTMRIAFLFSNQLRLLTLIIGCALLWSIETLVPLYLQRTRFRRAMPNIGLAAILIVINLACSSTTAGVAAFTAQHGFGILISLTVPVWLATLLGVAGLDLFTYF